MSEGARGNRKLILILSALLASCGGGSSPANEANGQNAAAAQTPARPAAAFDWGDPGGEGSGDPQYARSQALCRQLRDREPPAADRPAAQAAALLRGCDAEALYYGIGVRRDPARARACAFTQAPAHPSLEPFAGRAMLMTIYANGTGARRDVDVAIHLACGIAGLAPAEYDARVTHLARLRGAARRGPDFHYCDDIRGGLAEGCARRTARLWPGRSARRL